MEQVPKAVTFFEDGDYVDQIVLRTEEGENQDVRQTGWYEVKSKGDGWARIEVRGSEGGGFLGVALLEFSGRELRVTDESGDRTSVYRRP
jgi:hypothetical protein